MLTNLNFWSIFLFSLFQKGFLRTSILDSSECSVSFATIPNEIQNYNTIFNFNVFKIEISFKKTGVILVIKVESYLRIGPGPRHDMYQNCRCIVWIWVMSSELVPILMHFKVPISFSWDYKAGEAVLFRRRRKTIPIYYLLACLVLSSRGPHNEPENLFKLANKASIKFHYKLFWMKIIDM